MKAKLVVIAVLVLLVGAVFPASALAVPKNKAELTVTTVRTATTEQIFLAFSRLHKGTYVEVTEAFTPDGMLYQTWSSEFSPVKRESSVMHEMAVTGTWAESLPGTWRVSIYLDGVLLESTVFDL